MKNFCITLFFLINISCNAQDREKSANNKEEKVTYNKKSIALNNEAVMLLLKEGRNRDSILLRANQLLDSAIQIDRTYHLAYSNKIQNLVKLKQYQQALAWSDSALSIRPGLAEVLTGKGLVYDKLGDSSRAKASYMAGNVIYESRYASEPTVHNLISLAFNYYLSYSKAKCFELIEEEEEYRFKNSSKDRETLNKAKVRLNKIKREEILGN
ncbi:MAG: hypothetical protein WBP45_12340 [Daejeonella sp.]